MKEIKETPSSIYLMHKYWGKKPSKELKEQILNYTKKNDLVLDPFAGYGGIGIEATIEGRNVILNDLNPSANFISDCILEKNIDLKKLEKMYYEIMNKCKEINEKWYTYKGKVVLAAATTYLQKKFGVKENKQYFKYYDEVTITVDGEEYEGLILDTCGACYKSERVDLFVENKSSAIDRGYKGIDMISLEVTKKN